MSLIFVSATDPHHAVSLYQSGFTHTFAWYCQVLSIALSVDYNLFLVSRWREELVDGATHAEAVTETIATAGEYV